MDLIAIRISGNSQGSATLSNEVKVSSNFKLKKNSTWLKLFKVKGEFEGTDSSFSVLLGDKEKS